MKTTIISDIHLGSSIAQVKLLYEFLKSLNSEQLIINGDLFDNSDFRRLTKYHWRILSEIRKLSDHVEIIYIRGNHDLPADLMSHLLGVNVVEDYEFISGNKKILVLHGHIFDEFLDDHPILTFIGDQIYNFLQWIDKSHYFAKLAKHNSKHYLRCTELMQEKSINLAKGRDCQIVALGHSHHAVDITKNGIQYINSGCWTELPCGYIEIENGSTYLGSAT